MRSSSSQRQPGPTAWLLVLVLMVSVGLVAPVTAQAGQSLPGESESIQASDPTETPTPTEEPVPTDEPTAEPTNEPTAEPTTEPTAAPTEAPIPTEEPTETGEPATETPLPTETATNEPAPTGTPTGTPTEEPFFQAAALQQPFFDQPSYTAIAGGSLTVTLTIPMQGRTEGGRLTVLAASFTNFTSVSAAPTSGDVSCNARLIAPAPFLAISGTFAAVDPGGACILTITLAIENPPSTPFTTPMLLFVSADDPTASFTGSADVTIRQAPTATLMVSLSDTNPQPGETITVTLQQTDDRIPPSTGFLRGDAPAGTTLVPGSGTATCAPPCPSPPFVIVSGSFVSASYDPQPASPVTVTLSYQVTIATDTSPGSVITFTGNGNAGGLGTGPIFATLTVVAPVVADDQAVSVPYQGTVDGTLTVSGGVPPLSLAVTTPPTKGTLTVFGLGSGIFIYTANHGQTGTDSFTFTATDSASPASSDTGTVTITIGMPLTADDLAVTVPYQGTVDGTVTASSGTAPYSFSLATPPAKGVLVFEIDGAFTYTANPGQTGSDSFTFTASDSGTPIQSDSGTVTITIGEPVTANGQAVTVPYQGTVDGTVTASGGTPPLTYAVTAPPTKGTLALDPDGTFSYTANPGKTGTDSFTFTATDSASPASSDTGTITITIGAPDALVAAILTLTLNAGQSTSGELAGQVSGGIPPYTFRLLTAPSQGTATVEPDGSIRYTANPGASGTDSFTYTVTDSELVSVGAAATTTGTVKVIIAALPTPTPTDPVLTPSPTLAPGVTPTATSDNGMVGPGDPKGDESPVDPRSTETPSAGAPGHRDDGPITRLPSTGQGEAGSDAPTMTLLLMLVGAMLVVAGAALARRRAGR